MDSTLEILERLIDKGVEFVLIGGLAGTMHGCSLVTEDVDIAAPFTPKNLQRLLAALDGLHPRHRMTPARKPLTESVEQLTRFQNVYLETDLGPLDVLSEVDALGDYEAIHQEAIVVKYRGRPLQTLGIAGLIRAKQAMGRPRDRQMVMELEAIRERLGGDKP